MGGIISDEVEEFERRLVNVVRQLVLSLWVAIRVALRPGSRVLRVGHCKMPKVWYPHFPYFGVKPLSERTGRTLCRGGEIDGEDRVDSQPVGQDPLAALYPALLNRASLFQSTSVGTFAFHCVY